MRLYKLTTAFQQALWRVLLSVKGASARLTAV